MDHTSKKHCPGTRSSITFRDPGHRSKTTRGSNRADCNPQHSSTIDGDNNSEKLKMPKPSFRTIIKHKIGSSSKAASPGSLTKSKEKTNPPSRSKKIVAETSHYRDLDEESDSSSGNEAVENSYPLRTSIGSHSTDSDPDDTESGIFSSISADAVGASCSRSARSETHNLSVRRIRPGSRVGSSGSSIRHPIASQNANQSSECPRELHANSQRYGLRNLSCRSITEVFESGCSSSAYPSNRTNTWRRKHLNADSPRSNVTTGSLIREDSTSTGTSSTPPSVTRRPTTQPTSQRVRNRASGRYTAPGSRAPNTTRGGDASMRFVELADGMPSLPQEPRLPPQFSESEITRSLLPHFREAAPTRHHYNGGTGRGTRDRHGVRIADGSDHLEFDPFMRRSGHRRFNMDEIEEVFLALDRIEHDEEFSYEELMMLESNFMLGAFSFHDQHRDLRLDIDNMSYEELLALGEKMGTVNTSLSEEEMSKCISKTIFKSTLVSSRGVGGVDDTKCSICQEEYVEGEDVGKLVCEHLYHVGCIREWFRLKNWCPICKSPALPASKGTATTHGGHRRSSRG